MKKEDYLQALEKELSVLPQAEKQEIMDYFTEYADELGEEANFLEELGQPAEVAKDLLTNLEVDWTGKNKLGELDQSVVQSPLQHLLRQVTQERSQTQANKKEVAPFNKIEYQLSSVDLRILPSGDGRFYYSYQQDDTTPQLDVQVVDKKLVIRTLKDTKTKGPNFTLKIFSFHFLSSNTTLTIYLPKDQELLELMGQSTCGDVQLEHLHAHNCQLELGSGDVTIHHCQLQDSTLQTLSGDIAVKQSRIEQGQITTTNGDCELFHLILKQVKLNSLNGDVELAHSMIENTDIQLSNGDISLANIGLLGQATLHNANGDTELRLTKEQAQQVTITAKVTGGDLSVNGQDLETTTFHHTGDKSQANLTVSNANGDISLYL